MRPVHHLRRALLATAGLLTAGAVVAQTPATDDHAAVSEDCLLRELAESGDDVTVGTLRDRCREPDDNDSLILERFEREQAAESIRSLLTPHKRNFLLPVSYVDDPNEAPFADASGQTLRGDDLKHVEAKFQLSLKVSLAGGLLTHRDRVYFGFTSLSFWQAYNRNVSAPFRETNYEPELFWSTPLDWGPWGLDAGLLTLGVSHQSNGRSGALSRSWNRIYADVAFEKDDFVVGVKPWWRIPEDEKEDPLDAIGDDNPDIERYLGHFELRALYRRGEQEWSAMVRSNFDSGKGALQLEWTFPLWRGMRGYAQYFDGYGESLIDYDAHIRRIGVGILLNDLL